MKRQQGTFGLIVGLLLMVGVNSQGQPQLTFTSTQTTTERAVQLHWQSETDGVYRIDYTPQLSPVAWNTLIDDFPSQGSNTVFLDTGKYWTEPVLPHPKDGGMRFYRLAKIGTNTLVPPVVAITNLSSGADIFGEIEVGVHVATTDSITSVNFFVDGEELDSVSADDSGNASCVINTTEWPNGTHIIFVVAQTSAGTATTGEFQSTEQSGAGTSSKLPVTFDNYISQWNFSLPGFDPSLGETQHITAQFISYSSWTLRIVDEFNNTVRNASGNGSSMAFDWDGNDNSGNPTADGTYDFVLTATKTTAPRTLTASSAGLATAVPASTELLAMPADGSGSPVPLALYPPGMDTSGLTIFEGLLADFLPQTQAVTAATESIAMSVANAELPTPLFAGNSQTTQKPNRPAPKRIKGTPGKLGVAWQGDHPDPGSTGISGFNRPANLTGSIQLSPVYLLPYGPIKNAGVIANKFEKTMKKYKWTTAFNYGDDQVTASLLRKTSKGGQNLFNYCNIGLFIGHGIRGANQDFKATSTPSLQTYLPIYKQGVNAYDWVRMSEFDFGGGPGGLRWMGLYACNMLSYNNAQDMYNKGVLPMNFNLHILLAEETSIFMYPEMGAKWASYMNGGEAGGKRTVMDSWILASQKIHSVPGVVPAGHTVTMTCAYWPDCVNDSLNNYTDNSSTDPSDILFRRVQVYP